MTAADDETTASELEPSRLRVGDLELSVIDAGEGEPVLLLLDFLASTSVASKAA